MLSGTHRDDNTTGQKVVDAAGRGGLVTPADFVGRCGEIRALQQHRYLFGALLSDGGFLHHRLSVRQTHGAAMAHDLDLAGVRRAGELQNLGEQARVVEGDQAIERIGNDEFPG